MTVLIPVPPLSLCSDMLWYLLKRDEWADRLASTSIPRRLVQLIPIVITALYAQQKGKVKHLKLGRGEK